MAVFCGACARRIFSAPENEGSFQTTGEDFGGWDKDEGGRSRIGDTCRSCATILRSAMTDAARKIADARKAENEALKVEMAGWEERQKRIEKAKSEFERDWLEQRRKLGL
jgi:hypothetical protein